MIQPHTRTLRFEQCRGRNGVPWASMQSNGDEAYDIERALDSLEYVARKAHPQIGMPSLNPADYRIEDEVLHYRGRVT